MYFGQFLNDLGLEATTELREEAGRVLFKVTPTDGTEALARIREALSAFLAFPDAPQFEEEATKTTGVAIQQLAANVQHLKSQLQLSQAILQTKDATIEAFEFMNASLAHELGERNRTHDARMGRTEEPVGEYLAVRTVEKGGLVIKLPNILRDLKRRLR